MSPLRPPKTAGAVAGHRLHFTAGPPAGRRPGPGGAYPEGPGAEVRNQTQLFQLIALGRTTVVMPESSRANLLEGLAAVPVLDAPAVTTVIAWPPHSRSRALAEFVRVATHL